MAGVQAGEERAARGRANRAAGISVGKAEAGASELVDMRGLYLGLAIRAQVAVAHIVGEDEHDVGARRGCLAGPQGKGEQGHHRETEGPKEHE